MRISIQSIQFQAGLASDSALIALFAADYSYVQLGYSFELVIL